MDELVIALSDGETIDFKALFVKVNDGLRSKERKCGNQEVLRLRCYERLLKLVASGFVQKTDKTYRALEGLEQASSGHHRGRANAAVADRLAAADRATQPYEYTHHGRADES